MKKDNIELHNIKTHIFMWREWFLALALAMFSSVLAWYFMGGRTLDLSIPFVYNGDAPFISWLIKRLIDGTWYFQNDASGFPFGSDFYDYPNSDFGNLLVLKIIGVITGNFAYTMNIYFLLGFAVTALVSFFVLRSFALSRTFSLVGAILFTFLPFHFMRLQHLFYTWYFVVPVFTWYSFKIFSTPPLFFQSNTTFSSKIFHAIVLLGLSSFGVYYSFFGVLMLFSAGAIASFQQQSWKNLSAALIAILLICSGVGINLMPKMLYQMKYGSNHAATSRQPMESELYGLKITQLLLPRPNHRLGKLAKINNRYSSSFLYINENSTATLGLLGDIGFLILMGVLLVRKPKEKINQRIVVLASLTLILLLVATIGGFSALFALLVTPLIRGWNRISVFIDFTSITALMVLIDIYLKRKINSHFIVPASLAIGVVLILFGIWDQTTQPCIQCSLTTKQEFISDQQFVQQIERILPTNAAVYQFPYMSFPEVPNLNALESYGLMKGYLHSSHLKWSYGGIKGRLGDQLFNALSKEPLARQIKIIKELGFRGIYIDRRGYTDNGQKIERELNKLLGKTTVLVSDDQKLVFFLISPQNKLPPLLNVETVMEDLGLTYSASLQQGINFKRKELPNFLVDISGLSIEENWGRWSDANLAPRVKFKFKDPLPENFTLVLTAKAFGPNVGQRVEVKIGNQSMYFTPSATMKTFHLVYHLKKKSHSIKIIVPKPISPKEIGASTDQRKIGIGLEQMSLSF